MTVVNTTNRWSYPADGTTTTFPYDNRIFEASDLEVYLGDVRQTSGYAVSGVDEPTGGNVVFAAAPAAGVPVLLYRNVPATQKTKWPARDPFPSAAQERAADKSVVLIQQMQEVLARTVKRPITSTSTAPLDLPDPIPGRALKFAADGALTLSAIDPDTAAAAAEASASAAATSAGVAANAAQTAAADVSALLDTKVAAAEASASAAAASAGTATTKAAEASGAADLAVAAEANVAAIAASLPLMNGDGINADHQVALSENGWVFEATSAAQAIVVTLPRSDAALHPEDAEAGFSVIVQRKGANTVTVIPHPDDPATVAGVASYVIPDGAGARFTLNETPDPNNWIVTPFGAAVGDAEPIGAVKPFFRVTAPTGYLALNGVDFSAATYPDLTALVTDAMTALGYTNADAPYFYRHDDLGSPDAARNPTGQYVKMPNWSHRFFRNVGDGRLLGLVEEDAFQGHWHYSSTGNNTINGGHYHVGRTLNSSEITDNVRGAVSDGVNGVPRTADETRPKNVALLWCIKAAGGVQTPAEADIAALIAETQATNARMAEMNSGKPDYEATHAWAANTLVTIDHNLGVVPSRVEIDWVVDTPTYGYAVGDILPLPGNQYGEGGVYICQISDSSIQFRTSTYTVVVPEKASGSNVFHPMTPANGHIRIRAWKGTTFTGTSLTYADIAALLDAARRGDAVVDAAYTNGSLVQIPHGLGVAPSRVEITGLCVTSEQGIPAGKDLPFCNTNSGGIMGTTAWADDTNVNVRVGSSGPGFIVGSAFGAIVPTPANWRIRARCWR